MAGFGSVTALSDSYDEGRTRFTSWRKSPSQTTTIGVWFDLSMSPGNPVPQYYAASPLRATRLARSTDVGLDHGQPVSPARKFLTQFTVLANAATALPMNLRLCDYLLYYPFVDQGTTDVQTMDNTTGLSRYADGDGVQIMAVSVAAGIGGQTFQVGYINSDGVAGRLTPVTTLNAAAYVGAVASSDRAVANAAGPFLPLQDGDSGVRSIETFQMISGPDVGLVCLVLVKPLAQAQCRGIDAPSEHDYLLQYGQLPVVQDDAYLNVVACPSGALNATTLHGTMSVAWN